MGELGQAKTLGEIGSILELIPGVDIVGYILTLIAVKYISDSLHDRSIFNNMLYAVITGIVGAIVGVVLLVTGIVYSVFTLGVSAILGALTFLGVIWVVLIISALFIRRSYDTMATRLNVGAFRTAGTLYFVGAILSVVLIGFVILLVAYIFQIIAFFGINEGSTTTTQQSAQPAPPAQAAQGTRFCPNCGAQVDSGASFCKSCGKSL